MRRMRTIKQFIKVARQCKECKNFNSMFNIISGLGHGAVSRLKQTWEKLPSKYQRLFKDMQDLMDPSRNMSKYRNLITSEAVQPPMVGSVSLPSFSVPLLVGSYWILLDLLDPSSFLFFSFSSLGLISVGFGVADSVLPGGEEGPDVHPPGQRHARRRSHQLREAAHDRQGGAIPVAHVLGALRPVHHAPAGRSASVSRHDGHESADDRIGNGRWRCPPSRSPPPVVGGGRHGQASQEVDGHASAQEDVRRGPDGPPCQSLPLQHEGFYTLPNLFDTYI